MVSAHCIAWHQLGYRAAVVVETSIVLECRPRPPGHCPAALQMDLADKWLLSQGLQLLKMPQAVPGSAQPSKPAVLTPASTLPPASSTTSQVLLAITGVWSANKVADGNVGRAKGERKDRALYPGNTLVAPGCYYLCNNVWTTTQISSAPNQLQYVWMAGAVEVCPQHRT